MRYSNVFHDPVKHGVRRAGAWRVSLIFVPHEPRRDAPMTRFLSPQTPKVTLAKIQEKKKKKKERGVSEKAERRPDAADGRHRSTFNA